MVKYLYDAGVLSLLALAGLSISTGQAAEPTETLTLACQGTTTSFNRHFDEPQAWDKPQPVLLGLLVDFANGTLKGFPFTSAGEIKITQVTDLEIVFWASKRIVWEKTDTYSHGDTYSIRGSIDRVTGNLKAFSVLHRDFGNPSGEDKVDYSLKCKPTQRMF
jgi:hypothetical protein